MADNDHPAARTALQARLADLDAQLARLRGEMSAERDRQPAGDVEDAALVITDENTDDALISTLSDDRVAVEAALGRIDDGSYGQCEVDGGPIEPARLEARPQTTRCVAHAA